ncbi:hypothetical protein SAMN05443667_108143 [Flavobacterium gillisiae]|uniref:Uncharacterized protein n=1 Tax=Flavobacterium gillisiae TaxID=150146 RepID=A0A1H4DWE0_9FLAO|nr:hypothetical protein [Flavobacterium gillisiae]SEA76700.1 hypothetical protein SAMN05443667_108143 [Flavobacterium gillisiae]
MVLLAKWIVILFGCFLISAGFLMLFYPSKARAIIGKAGSTNFINYAEITIRMIPAAALVIYADFSKYPEVFSVLGWFIIATSLVLYVIPRKIHHAYAVYCAALLKPNLIRLTSPFSILFGSFIIFCVV